MPVRRFLRLACPTAPEWVLRTAFKERQVRVNEQRADGTQGLRAGDHVIIYTPWVRAALPIVFEDDQLLIISKPANVNSDRNTASPFSAISWAENYAAGQYTPILCHRLDNQTSGLLMLAKSQESADAVDAAMKAGTITKRYEAIVIGKPMPVSADRAAYLSKDAARAVVKITDRAILGARPIRTSYATLSAADGLSQLAITLHTGRTHQIRAHMAFLGHPVLGDDLYGNRTENRKRRVGRLCLCACELVLDGLPAPLTHLNGRRFTVPVPFELSKFVQEEEA